MKIRPIEEAVRVLRRAEQAEQDARSVGKLLDIADRYIRIAQMGDFTTVEVSDDACCKGLKALQAVLNGDGLDT